MFQHHVFDPLGPMWTSPRMVDSEGRANACEDSGSLRGTGLPGTAAAPFSQKTERKPQELTYLEMSLGLRNVRD